MQRCGGVGRTPETLTALLLPPLPDCHGTSHILIGPSADFRNREEHRCYARRGLTESWGTLMLHPLRTYGIVGNIGATPSADLRNRGEHRCYPLRRLTESWETSMLPPSADLRNRGEHRCYPSADFRNRLPHRCRSLPGNPAPQPATVWEPPWTPGRGCHTVATVAQTRPTAPNQEF
jgi:hypothetical protein